MQQLSKENRQRVFMSIIMALIGLSLILIGWNTWNLYHDTKTSGEKRIAIERLRGTIIHLDEVLTMSASMAAASGDPKWERRYREFEPQLDAAIQAAVRYTSKDTFGRAVLDTEKANTKLVKLENRSFDLVRLGRLDEARKLLFSPEYTNLKHQYEAGVLDLNRRLSAISDSSLEKEQRKILLGNAAMVSLTILLLIVWIIWFRAVRSWKETLTSKTLLEKEIADRRLAEERFKELAESLPETIFEMDLSGRLTFVNHQAFDQFGYSQQDFASGLNAFDMIIPSDRDRAEGNIAKILKTLKTSISEYTAQRKDGSTFPCLIFSTPIRRADRPVGLRGLIVDITDRKKVEEALRLSEERFRKLIEQSPITYEMYDKDGLQEMVNPAYAKLWKIDPSRTVGSFNVWETRQVEKLLPYLKRTYAGQSVAVPDTHWDSRKEIGEGRDRWISTIMYPIHNNQGEVDHVVILHEDITDRKLLQFRMQESQKMEAIGTLAAGIAHDFNNILSAVIGFSELALDETPESSAVTDHVREILRAGYRAKELVHHILTFSRQAEPECTHIQLKPLISEALRFLRATLPATIGVEQNLQSNAAVWGDPTQVHQIIMNLCTNGAQAMKLGGTLLVGLADVVKVQGQKDATPAIKPGEYVVLSVADTGHGIPAEIMDQIFNPFFTTKEKGEGTGMGLSVVHGIVTSLGGEIRVESRPGKGTAFEVYLPVFKERRKQRTAPPRNLPTGSERILVVDDEPVVAKAAGQMLKSLGYRVETLTDAAEAKRLIEAQPDGFDLVITDMMMPTITGDMLAKSLLKINTDLAIVLCTGFGEGMDERHIKDIGCRAVVKKPFLKRTLAETVRRVLDRPRPE